MKYAGVLIQHCPKEATQLFVDYYTGKYRPKIQRPPTAEAESLEAGGTTGFAAGAASAVQNLTSLLPLPYVSGTGPGTPSASAKTPAGESEVSVPELAPPQDYTTPTPRTAFSSFIDHPDEFILFLEACLKEPSLSESDQKDLYTTLFEMYLYQAKSKKGAANREEWEAKAKALIEDHPDAGSESHIENSNVLLLSHLSDFSEGTTLVREKAGMYFDIFRGYTSAKDTRGAIRALRKYGPNEPQLYPAALSYLTSSNQVLDEAGADELGAVLQRIDKDGLMAPLQVVQSLAHNEVATVGMVKPYLRETIERERRDIASNKRRAEAFRTETDTRRAELVELNEKPQVFQATRCSACGAALDLPTVHFLCKHSFHQRCLGGANDGGAEGGAAECPVCAKDNATIRALRKAQEENAGRHELFKDELERSEDRFGTIADWFGRGVMGTGAAVD
jgi:vacuolar protein sorting-associated protein 11